MIKINNTFISTFHLLMLTEVRLFAHLYIECRFLELKTGQLNPPCTRLEYAGKYAGNAHDALERSHSESGNAQVRKISYVITICAIGYRAYGGKKEVSARGKTYAENALSLRL